MAEFLEIKVSRDRLLLMKRLVVLMLALALLASPSAHGFFNRDCKNLAKRTETNQIKYEKAWNVYQSSLADWLNAGGNVTGFNPVLSRLRQVGGLQITILDDFQKNRKCMKVTNPSHYVGKKENIQNLMSRANFLDIQFSPIFRDLIDWRKEIKK